MWQQWLTFMLGVWIAVISSLIPPSVTVPAVMIISGILVALFGFWGATSYRRSHYIRIRAA